eukprot:TRINITY_DN39162_c0_g1_i1.p1 TRINITY_DN39162_c0_g1~~TRINITY_DN39162_c0_g1_i1.p1  ORF type:complete len:990 (-),score=307.99 TRINITY_DN39162_c0_g1_i1:357-3173(-)
MKDAAAAEDAKEKGDKQDQTSSSQVEKEEDAPEDQRPRIAAADLRLDTSRATPNVLPISGERLLTAVSDGGLQFLHAGVRTSVGIKSGRYMFELRILELLSPDEGRPSRGVRPPAPRQLLRLGLSADASSSGYPILGEAASEVYFDWEGHFVHRRNRTRLTQRSLGYGRERVFALVMNLGEGVNGNTVSLFRDGERLGGAQALPEELLGKTLYPTITYKNVTLQLNFGPVAQRELPFKCRMLQDASREDVEVVPVASPAAGVPEVLFPVGLPDQGIFDWVDQYVAANPGYLELSDRKVLEWARRSDVHRRSGSSSSASTDSPGMDFGLQQLDEGNVQQSLTLLAPALRRNLVHMRLKENLTSEKRQANLKQFPAGFFKRVAVVAMGEPSSEYRTKVQELMLAAKRKKAEEERERSDRRDKRVSAPWRSRRDGVEEKEPAAEGKEGEETEAKAQEGEEKEPEKKEGEEEADEKKEASDEPEAEKPVELTEEEKAAWHRKTDLPDLDRSVLTASFAEFSLPSAEEGFDEIRYVWEDAEGCASRFKSWVLDLKKTLRVEKLEPSNWFKERLDAWHKQVDEWKKGQSDAKRAGEGGGIQLKPRSDVEKKEEEGEAKEKPPEAGGEGDGADAAAAKEGGGEAGESAEAGKSGEEAKPMEVDEDELDVFALESIEDIGNGKPLYANFEYEDWKLLQLRYELHLLVHAFAHDLDDPERPSFHEMHFNFYYQKYYNKTLSVEMYGCKQLADVVALVKECAVINKTTSFLEALLPEEEPLDKFVRLTEEHRRDRQRCIDAGDETARLKFQRTAAAPPPPIPRHHGGSDGGRHYSGSSGGRDNRSSGGGYGRDSHRGNDGRGGGGGYNSSNRGSGAQNSSRGGYDQRGEKRSYDSGGGGGYPNKNQRYSGSGYGGGHSSRYNSGGGGGARDYQRGSYQSGGGGYGGRR